MDIFLVLYIITVVLALAMAVLWAVTFENLKAADRDHRNNMDKLQEEMDQRSKFDTKMTNTLLEENTGLRLALRNYKTCKKVRN